MWIDWLCSKQSLPKATTTKRKKQRGVTTRRQTYKRHENTRGRETFSIKVAKEKITKKKRKNWPSFFLIKKTPHNLPNNQYKMWMNSTWRYAKVAMITDPTQKRCSKRKGGKKRTIAFIKRTQTDFTVIFPSRFLPTAKQERVSGKWKEVPQ